MPKIVRKDTSLKDAIQAASMTYNRCRDVIAREFKIDPPAGDGPRNSFEMAVLAARATVERSQASELQMDDFSRNQIVEYLRQTALTIAQDTRIEITREQFIRHAIDLISNRGGLARKRIYPNAQTGHFAWMNEHMHLFLVRNRDVIQRSRDGNGLVIKPKKHVKAKTKPRRPTLRSSVIRV